MHVKPNGVMEVLNVNALLKFEFIPETILDNQCDNGETESENQEPDAGRAAVDAAEVCGDREEGAGAEGERPGREQGG